eukprot:6459086-Amphidinium_carterae.1
MGIALVILWNKSGGSLDQDDGSKRTTRRVGEKLQKNSSLVDKETEQISFSMTQWHFGGTRT